LRLDLSAFVFVFVLLTVARPLFFAFPADANTLLIDHQFMVSKLQPTELISWCRPPLAVLSATLAKVFACVGPSSR
jgi:hypothetical protein